MSKMIFTKEIKRILSFIFIFIAIGFSSLKAQDLADQAKKAYEDGDFRGAIDLYNKEIKAQEEKGDVSSQLYYNLGNSYFRVNEVPHAILNYERALLYNSSDKDIQHNIEYAQTKIEDKILEADNFFLSIWFQSVQNLLTSNAWAKLAVVLFLMFIGSLVLFFFSPKLAIKKLGFYAGIVIFVVLIFSNIFAVGQKTKIENRNTAIVMAGSATVVSSPSSSSKELFVLHAGTKVVISKVDGNWIEIEIANGSVGWVQKNKVEII